jgi:hypothetical protein
MKNLMNKIFLVFLVLVPICTLVLTCLYSCQKSGDAAFSDLPVVECYLSPGEKIHLKITEKIPYEESGYSGSANLNSLDIRVKFNGIEYPLASFSGGIYADTAGIIPVITDSSYLLLFNFNGALVTSITIIPEKPTSVTQSVTIIKMSQFDPENPSGTKPADPVEITFANSDGSYYLATIECIDTVQVPVFKDSIPDNEIFSSQPVTGTQINIAPMTIRYFGKNRIILYHVNPEYIAFFMHQASTSQNYEQPPSNIDNGLGIFTGVNADTLYLDVIQTK